MKKKHANRILLYKKYIEWLRAGNDNICDELGLSENTVTDFELMRLSEFVVFKKKEKFCEKSKQIDEEQLRRINKFLRT